MKAGPVNGQENRVISPSPKRRRISNIKIN
jgi:hypothetical protein